MLGPADGIDREAVDSSNIASIGYSPDRRVLAVEFKSGAIFHYEDVPPEFAADFYLTQSKGQFFNKHVRGTLLGQKMTGPCSRCRAAGIIGTACACGNGEHFQEEKRYAERTE
jgi:hypothetical protein